MINHEANLQLFQTEMKALNRSGVDDFLAYLLYETDFQTAPASTKYHLNVKGGLLLHSLNVLTFARLLNKELKLGLDDGHVVISSLLHDICKLKYYVLGKEWDKEWKDKTNQWRQKEVWKVEDELPLGHGEKSVIIANRFIDLSTEEMLAIRWHMAFSDAGVHFGYPSGAPFRQSMDKYPLVKVIAMADQMAELQESSTRHEWDTTVSQTY